MTLPDGLKQLTTVDEVKAAWGDLFIVEMDEDSAEPEVVAFAGNSRVAITTEAVFVQLRKPVKAGANLELTDVLRIQEPTVSDIRLTDKYKGEVEKAICLLSSICSIPNSEVNKMGGSDFKIVGMVLGAFL